jgi:plasmid stabilization system protein ParE
MKVRYTDTALAEIKDILSYIAEDNPLAADEVGAIMRATIIRLADYPRLAIETDIANVRVAPVLPYRYRCRPECGWNCAARSPAT